MAVVTELETFIQKFRQLWKSGHDARLEVETKAGKASVALHLRLGDAPEPIHGNQQRTFSSRTRNTSARDRRRARLAEARDINENMSEEMRNATEEVETKHGDVEEISVDGNIGTGEASSGD